MKVENYDLSIEGCLEYFSSQEAAEDWIEQSNLDRLNRYAQNLVSKSCQEHKRNYIKFIKVIGLGGEAVVVLVKDKILDRFTVYKIAFPIVNLRGRHDQYINEKNKIVNVYTNFEKKRYVRGGRLQGALSKKINRKFGIVPDVRDCRVEKIVWLEMDFISGKNPIYYYTGKSFSEKFNYFYRLLIFVSIIHSYKIVHRDIKPSNLQVVIDDDSIEIPSLLDWTFSKMVDDRDDSENEYSQLTKQSNQFFYINSLCFSSPRLVEGYAGDADYQDDIYSLGQVMYCLFTDEFPNQLKDFNKRRQDQNVGGVVFPRSKLSDGLIDIYEKATNIDEKLRYLTVSDYLVALENYAYTVGIEYPQVNIDFAPIKPEVSRNNEEVLTNQKTVIIGDKKEKLIVVDFTGMSEEPKKLIKSMYEIAKLVKENNIEFKE